MCQRFLRDRTHTPNKSLEPTAVGAFSSAIAVHVIWPRVPELWTLGDLTHKTIHERSNYAKFLRAH